MGRIKALPTRTSARLRARGRFIRLPLELLCAIAKEYKRQGGDPIVLAHTCSTLLHAINGMKSLWSSIYIGDSEDTDGACKCLYLDYFEVLLERAAPAPLSIIVQDDYVTEDVLQVLEPFSPFVHSFGIEGGLSLVDVRHHLIDRVSHLRFPNLQHLHIGAGVMDERMDERYIFCLLDLGNRSRQSIPDFEMHIYLYSLTLDMLQHGLFQRVTALRLVLIDSFPPLASIMLPHLEKLVLTSCDGFLGCAVMPKLGHLEISGEIVDLKSIPTHIAVLHLNSCRIEKGASVGPLPLDRLKRLVVISTSFEESFSACFRMISLEEFVLSEPRVIDDRLIQSRPVNRFLENFFGPLPSLTRLWLDLGSSPTQTHFFPSSLLALRMTGWRTSISRQDKPFLLHLEELILQDCDFNRKDFLDLLQDSRQKSAPCNIRVYQGDPPVGWSRYPFQSCPPFFR